MVTVPPAGPLSNTAPPDEPVIGRWRVTRKSALWTLAVITAVAGVFRFWNLGWGAPYFHFHIDEHYVFVGADLMRRSMRAAAESDKFFMYSPLPMYLVNALRSAYELVGHPLNLTVPADQVTYMVLGRSISATFGTATIPLVYAIGARLRGRVAGLLAAAFLAVTVLHLRDSHFFTVDLPMVFFCALAWLFALRLAERGDLASAIWAGMALGGAILCKYSGAFMALPIGLAYLLSPSRPAFRSPLSSWVRWIALGAVPLVVALVTFAAANPLAWMYFDKFRDDIRTWVTNPLLGAWKPIWIAQFADLTSPRLYWFTNLMWWGVGPALEILGLAGFVWLATRRQAAAIVSLAVPIGYYAAAGQTIAPMMRYLLPLTPALAVAAAVIAVDWLGRPRLRLVAAIATSLVLASSALYAGAYMNVFRKTDSRLAASRYIRIAIPRGARVMVEPSHNIPPMGAYLDKVSFYGDYVLWGRVPPRDDEYHQFSLDTYVFLYDPRHSDEEKRAYISERLSKADWIVMDDTYVQFYDHLPETQHAAVKQYYRDLFAGRLGFELVRTFKVYPSLWGVMINDDAAELTFRLFDHPRVFVFHRAQSGQPGRQ
jgi:4-amino-4-deoxy-L-arabinose transferase-like glycosyltransferase